MNLTINLTAQEWSAVQSALAYTAQQCKGTRLGDSCDVAWDRIEDARYADVKAAS